MAAWLSQDKETIWVRMEQNRCQNIPLDTIPFLNQQPRKQKHQEWDRLCKLPSKIEHFFILVIKRTIKTKIISYMYKTLQEALQDNSIDIKEKWELEMNTIICDKNWQKT